jgi:hypothetical protein
LCLQNLTNTTFLILHSLELIVLQSHHPLRFKLVSLATNKRLQDLGCK